MMRPGTLGPLGLSALAIVLLVACTLVPISESDRPVGAASWSATDVVTPAGWACRSAPLLPASRPDYFVAAGGDDRNHGRDRSHPFATLQRAADVARRGDVVWVRGGLYDAQVTFRGRGTAAEPIVFESHPGECAILDGSGSEARYGVRFVDANYYHFRNFVVRRSPAQGILLLRSHDNVISDVHVHHNRLSGIQTIAGDRNLFTRFVTHDNFDPPRGYDADGIGISSGTGNRIDRCVSYRNSDDGVDVWRSTGTVIERCISFENGLLDGNGQGFKAGGGVANGTVLRWNVAFGNRAHGFTYNAGTHITFDHNTAYANGGYGFVAGQARLRNNLAFANEMGAYLDRGGNVQGHNAWTLGMSDPRFADVRATSTAFLSLAPDSPAIDAGAAIGLPFDGSAPDLGAVPFGATLRSVVGTSLERYR